jgi:hypothetical protein
VNIEVRTAAVGTPDEAMIILQQELVEISGAYPDQFEITVVLEQDENGDSVYVFSINIWATEELPADVIMESVVTAVNPSFEVLPDDDAAAVQSNDDDSMVIVIIVLVVAAVAAVIGTAGFYFRSKRVILQNKDGQEYTVPI